MALGTAIGNVVRSGMNAARSQTPSQPVFDQPPSHNPQRPGEGTVLAPRTHIPRPTTSSSSGLNPVSVSRPGESQGRPRPIDPNVAAALNYAQTQHGPSQSALLLDRWQAQQNAGFGQAGNALSAQEQHSNHATNSALLNLQQQGLGLDRQDIASQYQGLDLDRQDLQLDRHGNVIDRGYIGQVQGIAQKLLESQIQGFQRDFATDARNTTSDFTSRGAFFAPFHKAELADHFAGALQKQTEAGLGYDRDSAGWQKDLAHLGISDQRIGLDEQRLDIRGQDLATSEQRLDLEAQRLGIQRQDLDNALSQGLQRLGLDNQINSSELGFMLASNDAQQAQLAMQILNDAFMYSGNPAVMGLLGRATANQGR